MYYHTEKADLSNNFFKICEDCYETAHTSGKTFTLLFFRMLIHEKSVQSQKNCSICNRTIEYNLQKNAQGCIEAFTDADRTYLEMDGKYQRSPHGYKYEMPGWIFYWFLKKREAESEIVTNEFH